MFQETLEHLNYVQNFAHLLFPFYLSNYSHHQAWGRSHEKVITYANLAVTNKTAQLKQSWRAERLLKAWVQTQISVAINLTFLLLLLLN